MEQASPSGPKKRQITDRRREQGRLAMKAYRQKQKARKEAESHKEDPDKTAENANAPLNTYTGHTENEQSDSLVSTGVTGMTSKRSTSQQNHDDETGLLRNTGSHVGNPSRLSKLSLDVNAFLENVFHNLDYYTAIPMDSYIRVPQYSLFSAGMENAKVLGVDLLTVINNPCGSSFSPWMISSYSTNSLTEGSVVPDLAPCQAQKELQHDLYIDCLPFKDFREKLLALRAARPVIFDETDFILDIHYRDGIGCPGPTPWEDKSWEAQTWFLKKWWMITGGENGPMGLTSRWWRMLRGEMD